MPPDPTLTSAAGDPAARALHRLAFLASAGEVLSSSLDYAQTLQHVAQLAVPELGDVCIVDIVEDGELRRLGIAHVLAEKRVLLHELAERFPARAGSPAPAAMALASGRVELLNEVTREVVASHTVAPEHARLINAIGIRSHLAVPMRAHGEVVGVLSLGVTESARRYSDDDIALAEEVARRAAIAVQNARLYRIAQDELARRRELEAELRLSERRFRAIVEQSPLSTQIFAADGTTRAVNSAWEALWGMQLADLTNYNVLTDPQLQANGIAALLQLAFKGQPVTLPTIAYDPNATRAGVTQHGDATRWVSALAYPIRDDDGSVREVVLVHTDVTPTHRAEAALRASEDRLHRALAGAHMNVWDWDVVTGHVECSDNAQDFWGMCSGAAAHFHARIDPQDRHAVDDAVRAALAGDAPYEIEYRLHSPGERVRWVQSRGRVERNAEGSATRVLGVTLDISDLKAAEEGMRVLADAGKTLGASLDYETTLDDLAHAVVPRLADWYAIDLLGEQGTLERASINHRDPQRLALAADLARRYPPSRDNGAWKVIETGQPEWAAEIGDELLVLSATDAEHLALLRDLRLTSYICVPMIARGVTIGALTLVYAESGRHYREVDVDLAADLARRAASAVDNARLYRELRAEHRRKDEFLATLAHELRNPLAPIRNGLALLNASTDAAVLQRTRAIMERQLGHMVRLIDDLLDLSRVTRGTIVLQRTALDAAAAMQSAVESSRPLIEAAGVALDVRMPTAPLPLDADHTRLTQILTNLLNNAAKFTPRGGHVQLAARSEGDTVLIEVSDDGQGLAPDSLEQVFEMFSRASAVDSHGGLGIGLTLARRLAELHGGALWAESAGLGQGSRFTLRLPRAVDVAALPGAPVLAAAHPHAAATARRVLVVDDNLDAAETLSSVLRIHGHDVRTAESAAQALSIVATFIPDVAFLDIGLPDMSGHALAQALRQRPGLEQVCLVALTGWGREEDRQRSREVGFDDHLTKPVDVDAVLERVARPR